MNETRERWAGIHTSIHPEVGQDNIYRVGFVWGLAHARGYGGEPQKVKTTATVVVRAEGDGSVPSILSYHAPELPLPGFDRQDYEGRALDAVKAWIPWHKRVSDLVGQVEQWGRELGWSTRRIEKNLEDSLVGKHQAPALLLQEDTWRILLEPIGRSAPGVEGVVDLYLMPAYDDIATLLFYGDRWNLHYLPWDDPAAATVKEKAGVPLSKEALRRVLEEMKQHAA
jgi:hypothetical protein